MNVVDLFHRLDQQAIEEYIRLRQPEDLHLDFKRVNDAGLTTVRETIPPDTAPIVDLKVVWELAAEGVPLTTGVLTVPGADILECVRPKWEGP